MKSTRDHTSPRVLNKFSINLFKTSIFLQFSVNKVITMKKAFILLACSCFSVFFFDHGSATFLPPFNGTCAKLCEPKDLNFTSDKVKKIHAIKLVSNLFSSLKLEGIWFLQTGIPMFFQRESKCFYVNFTSITTTTLFGDVYETNIEYKL